MSNHTGHWADNRNLDNSNLIVTGFPFDEKSESDIQVAFGRIMNILEGMPIRESAFCIRRIDEALREMSLSSLVQKGNLPFPDEHP